MAVAKHGNARLDFEETLFGRGQMKPTMQKETRERLPVSAAQQAASAKSFCSLHRPHFIILNRSSPGRGVRGGICLFLSTFAKSVSMNSRRWFLGRIKRSAPS